MPEQHPEDPIEPDGRLLTAYAKAREDRPAIERLWEEIKANMHGKTH